MQYEMRTCFCRAEVDQKSFNQVIKYYSTVRDSHDRHDLEHGLRACPLGFLKIEESKFRSAHYQFIRDSTSIFELVRLDFRYRRDRS